MSREQVRVASLLLEEGFGRLVETVGTHLLKHGASNLGEIVKGTGLKINQVRDVISCIAHSHVHFCSNSSGQKMFGRTHSAPVGTV